MGNSRSGELKNAELTDEKINEITKKTNLSKDEVLKWHKEFLVRFLSQELEQIFITYYKYSYFS